MSLGLIKLFSWLFAGQDVQKARQFLPFLQRAGRSSAIVEFVASGSRVRLFLPKETCLITFLLAGQSAGPWEIRVKGLDEGFTISRTLMARGL